MPTFEHKRSGRLMTVSGAAVEAAYEANPEWRLHVEEKPLTPKQKLQAQAEALGLSTDGTADEIAARIAGRPLTDDELLVAVEANVLDAVDAQHDPAEVRAKLAELAAK